MQFDSKNIDIVTKYEVFTCLKCVVCNNEIQNNQVPMY